MKKQHGFAISVSAICSIGFLYATNASALVISPSNMDTWAFLKTDASVTYGQGDAVGEMVAGPATPPAGTGSAHLNTGSDGFQSSQLRMSTSFVGNKISDLTSLSYSTYATQWNGQQLPYLTIYVDLTGDGLYDDRLIFEPTYSSPPQQALALNVWQTWDAFGGQWYADSQGSAGVGNTITLAEYLAVAAHLNATIVDQDVDKGGIRLASGFASPGDKFNTYVDSFTIGFQGTDFDYDFEPDATLTAVPEPASLALLALGLGGIGFGRRRKNV